MHHQHTPFLGAKTALQVTVALEGRKPPTVFMVAPSALLYHSRAKITRLLQKKLPGGNWKLFYQLKEICGNHSQNPLCSFHIFDIIG
jgi:hypothetical protein